MHETLFGSSNHLRSDRAMQGVSNCSTNSKGAQRLSTYGPFDRPDHFKYYPSQSGFGEVSARICKKFLTVIRNAGKSY
jgi:hypothetical protein